jgi:single-stranded-DNA-specific exonuclease
VRGAKLLLTIDCGVADIKEVVLANERGIDVIITDHHEPKNSLAGGLPPAFAVVNPKREDSKYPFDGLCGSGVAYKLVQALMADSSASWRSEVKSGMEKWSLDMVAIATLSDMVPLLGENRILARFGLEVLRKSPRPGLAALFKRLNMNQKNLSEDDIAFMITPRINAASRMGKPEDAFKLLSTREQFEAERLALHLEKINNERKSVVASVTKEAKSHLEKRDKIGEVIVVGNPEWRPSLLGLVANSLVEEYSRPAFVWGRDGDGTLKGSCRSYNGYNLHDLMSGASDAFIEFGGHAGAGGFSITLENLSTLEEKLSEALKGIEGDGSAEVEQDVLHINISDVGENLWQTIVQFAPFGMNNEKPVFKIPNAEIKSFKTFGKENNHLEIIFTDGKKDVKAISFFTSPNTYNLSPGTRSCTLLANLEKSYFRDRPELRLRVVDILN